MNDNLDRAVVIYRSDGTPFGCGILTEEPLVPNESIGLLEANIERYPGFNGLERFDGEVELSFFLDDTFRLSFQGIGLEANCNDCGIHIHEGVTCNNASLVGGHYWDNTVLSDPWVADQGAFYTTSSMGVADRAFYLYSGKTYQENMNHAVVVHAKDGTVRIGCGILRVLETGDEAQGSVGRRTKEENAFQRRHNGGSLRHKNSRAKGLRT